VEREGWEGKDTGKVWPLPNLIPGSTPDGESIFFPDRVTV